MTMRTIRRHSLIAFARACALTVGLICPLATGATPDEPNGNQYRLTLSPHHEIKGDLTGFGQFEYRNNPEQDYQAYQVLWPGLTYSFNHWLQLSGGWLTRYTDNEQSADTLELRPFAGVELSAPNKIKWNIYNYTRYEFRDTENLDTHDWTSYSRIRTRFGVEFPLTARAKAWQPKTWYGLADAEPFYRFDKHTIDPFRVRGGIAYIVSSRVRMEFIYHAQFTRPAGSSGLEFTDNIFRLNIKIALNKGIIQRVFDGGDAGD